MESVAGEQGLALQQLFPYKLEIIIQQIVTLPKYGHDAMDICHP